MVIKIQGIERQNYKLDSGYEFQGIKIHATDIETRKETLDGNLVMNLKVSSNSPLYSAVPYEVGSVYRCYFNNKGQLDFIQKVSPAEVADFLPEVDD